MRNKPPPRGLRGGGLFYIHLFDYEQLPVIAQREILSFINDKIRQNHIFIAHIEQKSSARLIAGLYAGRVGTGIFTFAEPPRFALSRRKLKFLFLRSSWRSRRTGGN